MEYTKFKEDVTLAFHHFGYKFTEILSKAGSSVFSKGYEIVLDNLEHSVHLAFLIYLSYILDTPYISVFIGKDVVSIIVYFK